MAKASPSVETTILCGDALTTLLTLPDATFRVCVTSPPYYMQRDYNHADQIGREADAQVYIDALVGVFREVRRVLTDDGTLWLNVGDKYANKQLLMLPARLALALQRDCWRLRSDVIWHKPNCIPEAVKTRPVSSYEHVFMLTKSDAYFYDTEAAREVIQSTRSPTRKAKATGVGHAALRGGSMAYDGTGTHRNPRNVWSISTQPYKGSVNGEHFATMPSMLVERCLKSSSMAGDTVIDPFGGLGTTGLAAAKLGRSSTMIELNDRYAALAAERIAAATGQVIVPTNVPVQPP